MARLRLPPAPRTIEAVEIAARWLNVAASVATRPRVASRRDSRAFSTSMRWLKRSSFTVAPVPHTQFDTGVARLALHNVAGLANGSNVFGPNGACSNQQRGISGTLLGR